MDEAVHRRVRCVMPWVGFSIETNEGDVYPCCKDWSIQSFGNVRSYSIEALRNSSVIMRHREAMLSDQLEDFCRPTCPKLLDGSAGIAVLEDLSGRNSLRGNAHLAFNEIISGKTIVSSTPILFQVMMTSLCNLHCVMCTQPHDESMHLPERFYEEMEKFLPGAFRITLLGGEVLADPSSRSYLLKMTREKLGETRLGLVTNGMLLDPVLTGRLDRYHFDFIIVSLNSSSPETYRRVHGKNGFDRVLHNMRAVRMEAPDIPLFFSFVVQPENHDDLPGFIEICRELGVGMKFVPVVYEDAGLAEQESLSIRESITHALEKLDDDYSDESRQLLHVKNVLCGTVRQ